jgi:Mrp family chromosome partitioning ATPase
VQDVLAARQADATTAAEEAPSLVQAVFRERVVVLACVVIAFVAGVGLSQLQTQRWTAQSRLFLAASADFDPLGTNRDGGGDAGRFVSDQVALMSSTPILNTTIQTLGLKVTAFDLGQEVKVSGSTENNVITIRASAADARTAKQIADGIPAAYQAYVATRVDRKASQAEAQSRSAAAVSDIRAAAAVYGDGVASVEPADLPQSPSSPQTVRNALVLALIGFLAATGYALYTQSWSRRRVGPVEASAIVGAPVLCEVPDRGRISAEDAIAAAYSEPGDAYRMAAVGLDYIRGTAPGVFLVTAPHDGAGTSLTALNLAAAAADHGRRVFLLNVEDTVRPQTETDPGALRVPLHDLARGRIDLGHAVERRSASRSQFGIIRLQVLQPVQGHPVPDVQQILDQLPDDTDLVLIDAPPLPASSASFVLAGQVDAAVVVIDQATTPADLEELQRRCRLAGIPVAGLLVNHIRGRATGAIRRRRRPAIGATPPRMYDTSPRGLPVLTGTGGQDARTRLPAVGASGTYGIDPQYGTTGYGVQAPRGTGARGPELPWSAVTHVAPGWEQEESDPEPLQPDAEGTSRSRG